MFFLPTIIEAFLTFYEEDDGKDSTRNILGARPFVWFWNGRPFYDDRKEYLEDALNDST